MARMTTTTTTSEMAVPRPRKLDKVRWGALFAGFFVGVGALFLLLSLGAAVGLTSVDPRDLGSWKTMGIGVGIWGGISAIISAFCSAWVASRLSTATDRTGGMLHGVALWGLTWAVTLWVGAMAIGGAVSGAGRAAGAAASATGGAASGISAQVTNTAVEQANAWLRENGKPEVPRPQLEAAMKDVAGNAMAQLRQGRGPGEALDHESVVGSIARNTNLSRADAEQLARQVEGQMQGALQGAGQSAGDVGQAAASGGKAGAWGAFLAALFTLIASALGGASGLPGRAREVSAIPVGRPATHHA
jgi:hypothetical protein